MNWAIIRGQIGLVIIGLAFVAALARVVTLGSSAITTDKKVVKMVHWQLETGIREALDWAAAEYEKLHPDVKIEQILIGERGYVSWVATRLIGGTAPELIEIGKNPAEVNLIYLRYYQAMSEEILKPNPYNAGTELADVPWKQTFYDSMESAYVQELLDYYSVGISFFTVRMFYNKDLLKEATGLEKPPLEFRAFLAMCEQIKQWSARSGRGVVPIASAGRYNANFLFGRIEQAVNSTLLREVDINFSSDAQPEETAIALLNGRVRFDDPRIRAMYQGRSDYIRQFQPAFYPADRMDAAFLFIQQKAVFIASGSWDAASYKRQAGFEIGVMDFPLPSKSDPQYGQFVEGPAVETISGGVLFSVNRASQHPDIALDYLRFLTSQRINGEINRRMQWMPIIRGNAPDEFMAGFWPNLDGVKGGIDFKCGAKNAQLLDEVNNLYSTGRVGFEGLRDKFLPRYVANSDEWMLLDRPRQEQIMLGQNELRLALERAKGFTSRERSPRLMSLVETQYGRRFSNIELLQRYQQARYQTALPTP